MDWTVYVCVCVWVCVFLVLTLIPVVWRIHLVDQISDFAWNKNIKHLFLPGWIVWMESLEAQAEGSTGGEVVWTSGGRQRPVEAAGSLWQNP